MGYDVIFYNLLTVNTNPNVVTADLFNVMDVYPGLIPGGSTAAFSPLSSYTNSPEDLQNPESKYWSFSVGRELGTFVLELGYTGSRGYHGINQIHANPAVLTPEQAALVAATKNAERHSRRTGPPRVPAVRRSHRDPRATSGRRGNDVEARSKYNGVYVSLGQAASATACSSRAATPTASSRATTTRRSVRAGRALRASGRRACSTTTPNGASRTSIARTASWSATCTRSRGRSRGSEARPRRLAGQRPHGVPVGLAVHDRHRRRLERRRQHRLRPAEPSAAAASTWDKEHKTFTNDGYVVAPLGTNNLPLANSLGNGTLGRNTERARQLLEHRPQSVEALLRAGRPPAGARARTRSTPSTRTTTACPSTR